MALDPALASALNAIGVTLFYAVQCRFPGGDLNLLDGVGVVKFAVDGVPTIFSPKDPIYGVIGSIGEIAEAVATSSPRLNFSLLPPTSDAVGYLCQPELQGSGVTVWVGAIDNATGLVAGAPAVIWTGRWDFANETITAETRVVDVESASSFDRLFIAGEGSRLNDVWHQSLYPGDDCLRWNDAIERKVAWGAEIISPATTSYPGGSSYGGGNSGGGGYSGGGWTTGGSGPRPWILGSF